MSKYTARSYDMATVAAQDKTFVKTTTGTAGATAVVTITHDGATFIYITDIIITATNPAAVQNGACTLSGLTTQDGGSGTMTLQLVESQQAGGQILLQLNSPIPSVDVNTDVVLTVPAIGSGGIVSATLIGYRRPE